MSDATRIDFMQLPARLFFQLMFVLAACGWSSLALAAHKEGFEFAEQVVVGGDTLVLNGIGVRAVSIIKGYVAALYVNARSTDTDALIAEQGAKRVTMRMLLSTQAQTFVDAVDSGIRKNYPPAAVEVMHDQIAGFDDAMRQIGSVRRGDTVDIDFDPARGGTYLRFNGTLIGHAVPGTDFYGAILKIFIGPKPLDENLKDGMLGLGAGSR